MAQFNKTDQAYLNNGSSLFEAVVVADKEGRIINGHGGAIANLSIAVGNLEGYASTHKFGAVPTMSQNATGTVWDKNDTVYPWSAFNTPGVLTIQTTAANGSAVTTDSGASVTIKGLDADFNEVEETIAISGSTGTGTQVFSRVWRGYFDGVGGASNTGQVRVSRGGTEVIRINIGKAQTLMAVYTIPVGYTGFIVRKSSTCAAGADATVEMYVRFGGESTFRVQNTAEVAGTGGQYVADFIIPLKFPEKSDIDFRATVRSNNARITASFDILMVRNDLLV